MPHLTIIFFLILSQICGSSKSNVPKKPVKASVRQMYVRQPAKIIPVPSTTVVSMSQKPLTSQPTQSKQKQDTPWWERQEAIILIGLILFLIFLIILSRTITTNTTNKLSDYFVVEFSSLSTDNQNIALNFKQGPHSWTLDGKSTGVIISDLLLNDKQVGFMLVFDNQKKMYLTYYELINLYKLSTNSVTMNLPDRTIISDKIFDSIVNSYQISLNINLNSFTFVHNSSKTDPVISYIQNGILKSISANAHSVVIN